MLAWTVEAAHQSSIFERVVVSTDDDEINLIAKSCGAEVISRPGSLADDHASLIDVVHHTLAQDSAITELCLLLANCPMRPSSEITRSWKDWTKLNPPALLSVVDYGWTPPFRAQSYDSEQRINPIMHEWHNKKSQFYPTAVCPSGAIYWANRAALLGANTLYLDDIRGFRMPWHLAIDIDTVADLRLAECLQFSLERGFDFGAPDGT